ncbi:cell envelope integrity EipB family protein [Microvirga flavescens]|uniref:cell envelope integrity EipB family protein n=1 Tax=Microvirga flavescens TaxID=2249811 RepID=UPI000DDAC9BB|nr:cell envelope integrity EipB family protein [Microvirga flavescens]
MRRSLLVPCILLATGLGASAPALPEPAVNLVPHRAVYDITLGKSVGMRGVDSARGRIALEFGGSVCDGYTMKYRQVTVLNGAEAGPRTIDVRTATYEAGDGSSMRFRVESTLEGAAKDNVDGEASLKNDGSLAVTLKKPKPDTFSAPGSLVFPTEHLKRLIGAARAGGSTLSVRLYDGSDDGKKVYDTLALIGRKLEGDAGKLEEPARQDALSKQARWPVTISYFNPGQGDRTPAYIISFDLYENGVSRALKLDYGDFSLYGELKSLELLPVSTCQR